MSILARVAAIFLEILSCLVDCVIILPPVIVADYSHKSPYVKSSASLAKTFLTNGAAKLVAMWSRYSMKVNPMFIVPRVLMT